MCTKNQTHHPGNPLSRKPAHVDDGLEATDGRGAAEVAVLEGDALFALATALDGVGGVQAALEGHLAHARQVVDRGHVAEGEDLGMPGQAQVGEDLDAPGPVGGRPRWLSASILASGEAGPRRPRSWWRTRSGLLQPSAPSVSTPNGSTPTTRVPSPAPRPSSRGRWWPGPTVRRRSWPGAPSLRRRGRPGPRPGRSERKSPVRLRAASSRICPASSTPVGPAPTMQNVMPEPLQGGVGHGLGQLERAVDPPAQLHGVVDRLHAGGHQGELVVAEVGLPGPGGHDQAVVGEFVVTCPARSRCARPARSRSNPVTVASTTRRSCCLRSMCRSTGRDLPRPRGCRWPPGRGGAGTGGGCAGRSG